MSQYPPVLIAQNSYCILASSFYSSSTLHMRVKFIVLSSFSCHRGQLTNVADMALVLFCWQLVLVSVGNVFFFTCRWGTCLQCFFCVFFSPTCLRAGCHILTGKARILILDSFLVSPLRLAMILMGGWRSQIIRDRMRCVWGRALYKDARWPNMLPLVQTTWWRHKLALSKNNYVAAAPFFF